MRWQFFFSVKNIGDDDFTLPTYVHTCKKNLELCVYAAKFHLFSRVLTEFRKGKMIIVRTNHNMNLSETSEMIKLGIRSLYRVLNKFVFVYM